MRSFIDCNGTITEMRANLARDVDTMVLESGDINCIGWGVGITSVENGNVDVTTIFHNGGTTVLKDETGVCHDYSDLNTDDMVAIYEHVYYRVNQ